MPERVELTEEVKLKIVQAYREGVTTTIIGRRFGIHKNTVNYVVRTMKKTEITRNGRRESA